MVKTRTAGRGNPDTVALVSTEDWFPVDALPNSPASAEPRIKASVASWKEPFMSADDVERPSWTFLSNHAHVLLCLARDSTMRLRDIEAEVGITERAIRHIISDLEDAGYVERVRTGRRNSYRINETLHLRHPIERHKTIADLIRTIHE
jgi:DNA-binding MarR family transcriptional regulator